MTRDITHNRTVQTASTTAIRMIGNATSPNIVEAVVPEASLTINEIPVQIGGLANQIAGAKLARFRSASSDDAGAVAGNFSWAPGTRRSDAAASWPPKGSLVKFEHFLPCASVTAAARNASDNGEVIITVIYEQYDGTSGFTRRLGVRHGCHGDSLSISAVNVDYLALANHSYVEFQSDTEASYAKSVVLTDGVRAKVMASGDGEGINALAEGETVVSYLMAEIFHSTVQSESFVLGGVDRYARERSRFWRLVTPQIEQMVVYVQGICTGGRARFPADGTDGSVGYWCYDDEGTEGMKQLIDQAKELKVDMLVFGQNMNSSWRSMIASEFQSQANISWFSELVNRAHNSSGGQHLVEVGVYQLLLNARSATGLNQAAPANAFDLPDHRFDAADPITGLPDHNNGKADCRGGPSCSSLCAGTIFYQRMKASMLDFWTAARLSAVDQDGSRYMPCSNSSHAHHHGHADSMRVQFLEVKSLFHTYLKIPASFSPSIGVPPVAFVTSASSNFLEAGQAKVPGGYNEYVWSLPRWNWIDLQRVLIIRGLNTLVNVQRYYPVPLSMPYHDVRYNPADPAHWRPEYGYDTNATLSPLESHLAEVNWALSQTFGTGVMPQLRSRYLYDGPQSKALLERWIAWSRRYSAILQQDFVTLSLATTCINETEPTMHCKFDPSVGIDAIIHHSSPGLRPDVAERAMAMAWNPTTLPFNGSLKASLYYSGLTHAGGFDTVMASYAGAAPVRIALSSTDEVEFNLNLGPRELTWIVVTAPDVDLLHQRDT